VSYNLGPVEGGIRKCELSAADHRMDKLALVPMDGFEFCPIEVIKGIKDAACFVCKMFET